MEKKKNNHEHDQYQANSSVKQKAPQTSYGFNHVDMISDEAVASNKHTAELTLFIDQQATVVERKSSQLKKQIAFDPRRVSTDDSDQTMISLH